MREQHLAGRERRVVAYTVGVYSVFRGTVRKGYAEGVGAEAFK
ncbi:MAG: hypothetical protein WCA12_19450 [Burkholderiales bacterium]